MAGGGFVAQGEVKDYNGKVTLFVIITCMIAATGGLIFGYDIGVSGGVTSMNVFLEKFFPSVYEDQKNAGTSKNQWCSFDSQLLTAFTSSLYIAGLISTFFASTVTRVLGRKASMLCGGAAFLIGSALNGAAVNVAMLIIGRVLLGVGIGFANQAVPLYLSEMAPPKLRGALNIGFQLATTIGILIANLVNYGTNKIKGGYGWRISLALAAVPAGIMTIGALFLPDTPNSLIERGKLETARRILQKARGTDDVGEELQDMVEASQAAGQVRHPWKNILQKHYRPQLVMAFFIPGFQQLTGINIIMFYAPVLFKTIGFGDNASLMSAVITGLVNVGATLVSIATVDRFGRRFLFIEGGAQMLLSQVAIAVILGVKFGADGTGGHVEAVRRRGAGAHLHLRGGVRVVLGAARVAGAQRDLPAGDPVGGAVHRRLRQLLMDVPRSAVLPLGALPPQVRPLLALRRLRDRHDALHRPATAGDKECAHRGDECGLEEALVLEELRP